MATKADLEARIAQLEEAQTDLCALLDAVTDAAKVRGVSVWARWDDASLYHITVAGRNVSVKQATQLAGVFQHAIRHCQAIMAAGITAINAEVAAPDAGQDAEGGGA